MTLTEFLIARIAEDWAAAQWEVDDVESLGARRVEYKWLRMYWRTTEHNVPSSAHVDGAPSPARVLAECEAKRRLVDMFAPESHYLPPDATQPGVHYITHEGKPRVLQILALPYADHPDYRQEWKP